MSRLGAVALSFLLVLLAGCGGSEDEPPEGPPQRDPFFGIAPFEAPTDADLARMAEGGVGSFRVQLGWPSIETSKGSYDWSTPDAVIERLARHGMQPLPSVNGTPSFYAPETTIPPTTSEEALDAWADFLEAAARRYGPDGTFWQQLAETDPDVAPRPLRVWEIWNEPNSSVFWKPAPDPAEFATLLARSAKVLRGADPEAEIVTGGMFATPQSEGAIVSFDFLDQLYAEPKMKEAIDAVGIHPYGANVGEVVTQLDRTREAIDEAGDDATIRITEIGWGSNPDVPNYLAKSREQQAKLLEESFTKLSEQRDRWDLEAIIWFTWHDSNGPIGECLWCATAGLVDADRDTKPAWRAFTKITGGTP